MEHCQLREQKPEDFGNIVPLPLAQVAQSAGAKLARESKRTRQLKETLPRGITIGQRNDGREKPFFVRFGLDRTTESFKTEKERNDRAQKLAEGVSREGTAILDFDPIEWRALQDFKRRTGVSLPEAERIIERVKGNLRLNLTTSEAVDRYMELKCGEGLSRDSISHTRLHLGRFVSEYGALPLYLVTTEKIRDWMDSVRRRFELGPIAVRHHRKTVHVFFERALIEKWTMENPCKAVVPPRVYDSDTTVLPVQDIFRLLKANRDQPVVGKIGLELYGFMRCSSVERIVEAHVKWNTRGIEMKGATFNQETGEHERAHKSGKRKFRQGHPPVLWEWLKHASPACWSEVTHKNYDERKAEAFIRADVKNPGNVLRHSCASYTLAVTKNMPYVSYMMQHTSLRMTERYEGQADEHDGKLVLAMTPAAVRLEWNEFSVRWAEFYQPINSTRL